MRYTAMPSREANKPFLLCCSDRTRELLEAYYEIRQPVTISETTEDMAAIMEAPDQDIIGRVK